MKNKTLTIALLCLLPMMVAAENAAHGFVIWGNGGVKNYVGLANSTALLGGGGGIGFGYELFGEKFLFQTGIGGTYSKQGINIPSGMFTLYDQRDYDVPQQVMDYQCLITNRTDKYTNISAQIPLLLGAHFKYFYFLMGAKVHLDIYNPVSTIGTYSSRGVYPQLIDPLSNMPNHQYFNETELTSSDKNPLKVNVAASAEIGSEFVLQEGGRRTGGRYLRVGAFVDFNVLDERVKSSTPMFSIESMPSRVDEELINYSIKDYLHSSDASAVTRNFLAGVKLTLIFTSGEDVLRIFENGYYNRRNARQGRRILIHNR